MAITCVAIAFAVPAGVAGADVDPTDCNSMLAVSIGFQLETQGFDMTNVCKLTISDLATIKSLLETEGMGSRVRIQQIMDKAG